MCVNVPLCGCYALRIALRLDFLDFPSFRRRNAFAVRSVHPPSDVYVGALAVSIGVSVEVELTWRRWVLSRESAPSPQSFCRSKGLPLAPFFPSHSFLPSRAERKSFFFFFFVPFLNAVAPHNFFLAPRSVLSKESVSFLLFRKDEAAYSSGKISPYPPPP